MTGPDLTHPALRHMLSRLISQHEARVLVAPPAAQPGYWFGAGNLALGDAGEIWLTGRHRVAGDSRLGLEAGWRGLECLLLRSSDGGRSFQPVRRWQKADLVTPHGRVLSIEGTALHRRADGEWELFISFEIEQAYPEAYASYQKPGTGVWCIARMAGPTPDRLDERTLSVVLRTARPEYLHLKDPVVYDGPSGETMLLFCSHPISWASTNTGLAMRRPGAEGFGIVAWEAAPRGPVWDVAAMRITSRLPVPRIGAYAGQQSYVCFYDGAESLRRLDENPRALKRPRGYSCEEIGGALWLPGESFAGAERLSDTAPLFVSPFGTGCSRYVSTLATEDGILAAWQQGQADGSQPLVGHWVSMADIRPILSAPAANARG